MNADVSESIVLRELIRSATALVITADDPAPQQLREAAQRFLEQQFLAHPGKRVFTIGQMLEIVKRKIESQENHS